MKLKEDLLVKDERYECVSVLLKAEREMLKTQVRGETADDVGLLR